MEFFTHVLLFFFGMAMYYVLRHGLSRYTDITKNQYFVSATITFISHQGNRIEHHYAGSFKTESRDPDKMVREFKNAFLKLVAKEMPEEVFQLSDKDNYYIQIYSMNRV